MNSISCISTSTSYKSALDGQEPGISLGSGLSLSPGITTLKCNNCQKPGHLSYYCRHPINSFGIICVRRDDKGELQYLLVCRNISHGYMDLIRGKYVVNNKTHLKCLIDELTAEEKENVLTKPHLELWNNMWNPQNVHKDENRKGKTIFSMRKFDSTSEQKIAQDKLDNLKRGIVLPKDKYSLESLIAESKTSWPTCEWSFPKGRKECDDSDYDCALREWSEETGYSPEHVTRIENVSSYKEIFMGTNYLTYKTTLFLGHWKDLSAQDVQHSHDEQNAKLLPVKFDKLEVSARKWCSYEECLENIRPYHKELRTILQNVNSVLTKYELIGI